MKRVVSSGGGIFFKAKDAPSLRAWHSPIQTRFHLNALFLLLLLGTATAAEAQVQPELAKRYFEEAAKLCERDAGRLWGVSLCGPIVIFDQRTGTRATSQPEPAGPLPRFSGFADGPVSWGGLRWFSFPLSFLPETDADVRQQVMLHGLFHRIQPELGLITEDGFNEHLDTLEGRFWMRLEWRALRFTQSGQWGRLEANSGVLRSADGATLSVPVTGPLEGATLRGDGWSATLNSGWVVRPAARPGSFVIVREN